MSAPSQAPSRSSAVIAPDVSSIVTEDDTPVDNIYSEKQQRLLTDALYTSWAGPPPEEDGLPRPFVATANVGVFSTPTDPPVVPDVLVSLDVRFGEDVREKEHRTYFVWIFGKVPDVVIEVVSNREGEEFGKKKRKYQRMLVPSYVVWDPAGWLSETPLQTFELRGSLYIKKRDALFEALGLGLVPWEGSFEGHMSTWLRWVDAAGTLLPTGAERALQAEGRERQAQTRADDERKRADGERERAQESDARAARLAEKLRALGVDPDAQ